MTRAGSDFNRHSDRELTRVSESYDSVISKLKKSTAYMNELLKSIDSDVDSDKRSLLESQKKTRKINDSISIIHKDIVNLNKFIASEHSELISSTDSMQEKIQKIEALLSDSSTVINDINNNVRVGVQMDVTMVRRLRLREISRVVNTAKFNISKIESVVSSVSRTIKTFVSSYDDRGF